MKLQYKIAIFVFLILLEAYFDPYIKQCDSLYGKFLMLVHHFLSIFTTIFSLLFGFHLFHFCFVFMSTFLFVRNYGCVLSFYHNNICNIDKWTKFPSWLHNLSKTLNFNEMFLVVFINSIVMIYDLYMIFFIKKNLSLLT